MFTTVRYRMPVARQRLTAEAWVAAALEALEKRGLAAVAVEPLAAELGATKGSFYWHFKDRDALVHATLERWEHDETDAVISQLAAIGEPGQRLEVLVRPGDHGTGRQRPRRVDLP
jgi:AcrR family transcriptional regulator